MKNIHLLQTDKPSRLFLNKVNNKLLLEVISDPTLKKILPSGYYQHIYITSDEEIKEGDWFYVKTANIYGGNIIAKCLGFGENCWSEHILTDTTDEKGYHPSHCVKIILTTDQDLIKDGVQSIDDEFLEWFVKNPSCEEIEVSYDKNAFPYGVKTAKGYGWYKIIIPKEEPKQETLEKEMYKASFANESPLWHDGFIAGAKWWKERSYSEEDMSEAYFQGWVTRERFDDLSPDIIYPKGLDYEEKREYAFNLWFEKFKKK